MHLSVPQWLLEGGFSCGLSLCLFVGLAQKGGREQWHLRDSEVFALRAVVVVVLVVVVVVVVVDFMKCGYQWGSVAMLEVGRAVLTR